METMRVKSDKKPNVYQRLRFGAAAAMKGYRFAEAWPNPGGSVDRDDHLYRKLTGGTVQDKDLTPFAQERMARIAYWLYDVNPLAKGIINLLVGFTVGRGINFTTKDKHIKSVLDLFWKDPVNKMEIRQHDFARDLFIFGELCNPVSVNQTTGQVRLGYVDPTHINKVLLNRWNPLIRDKVFTNSVSSEGIKIPARKYKIINQQTRKGTKDFDLLSGDCFFSTVNNVSNSARGRSSLLAMFDWLDGYNTFLFSKLEKAIMQNCLVWDVTLTGQTPTQVRAWAKDHPNPPKSGSTLAHNEFEEWKAIVPDFKSSDSTPDALLFQSMIAVGPLFPRHYLSLPSDGSRAIGVEMAEPTFKNVQYLQKVYASTIEHNFNYAIDQAIMFGRVDKKYRDKSVDRFSLTLPDISPKNIDKISRGFERVVKGLDIAVEKNLITKKTSVQVLSVFTSQLGINISVDSELDDLNGALDKSGVKGKEKTQTLAIVKGLKNER